VSESWRYVGDQRVLEFFDRCRLRERQRLLEAMNRLVTDPYVEPQAVRPDRVGRPVSIILLNGFVISYWLDHFVNEVRVIEVSKIS
jgi:hypothetical protein